MWLPLSITVLAFLTGVHTQSASPGKGKASRADNSTLQYLPPESFSKQFSFTGPLTLGPNDLCSGSPGSASLGCIGGHIRLCIGGQTEGQAQIIHNCRTNGCSVCPAGPDVCNDNNGQNICSQVPSSLWTARCQSAQPITFCWSDVRWCNGATSYLVEYCPSRVCTNTFPQQCVSGGPTSPTPGLPSPTPLPPTPLRPPTPLPPTFSPPTFRPPSPLPPGPTPSQCGPRIRREWGSLPPLDKQLFVSALVALGRSGSMERDYARSHWNLRNLIHGTDPGQWTQFLVWHRVFLFDLEERIRAMPGYECVTIPYWNYDYSNTDTGRSNPRSVFGTDSSHLGGSTPGCIGGAFSTIQHTMNGPAQCIARNPNGGMNALSCSAWIDLVNLANPDYYSWALNFQNVHGNPHVAVNGTFGNHRSPIDPLFFPHHANIDRVWDMWQDCHRNYNFPGGINAPVQGYPVVFSDFIDNYNVLWQGRRYRVEYANDQFRDRTVYGPNFRTAVSRCVEGRFLRYDTPPPFFAVDLWAAALTPQGIPFTASVSIDQKPKDVQCLRNAGTAKFEDLGQQKEILATYDSTTLKECLQQCPEAFWKPSGPNNCACTVLIATPIPGFAPKPPQPFAVIRPNNSTVTVNSYEAKCDGPKRNYALFSSPVDLAGGRVCFEVPSSEAVDAPIACSSPETTPPPLPPMWIRMNHLDPAKANACAQFRPVEASPGIRCLNT